MNSAHESQIDPNSTQRFRWNLDSKLVCNSSTKAVAVNFATGKTLTLSGMDASQVATVSGLAIGFQLPDLLSHKAKSDLIRHCFFVPEENYERYEQTISYRLSHSLNNSHGFIVMPTGKCNFRCVYCYEDFQKGRMPESNIVTLDRAIERVATDAECFALGFFGGEPLLCPDLVKRFSKTAFQTMRDRGLPYSAGIATNGSLLTPILFQELLDVGVVSYQITLDGDRSLHDRQRKTSSGRSSFDRVVKSLKFMANSDFDFSCTIRCNLRDADLHRILELIDTQTFEFLKQDLRFVIDIHTVWESDRQTVTSPSQLPVIEPCHGSIPSACTSNLTSEIDRHLVNQLIERAKIRTTAYSLSPTAVSRGCYAGKANWFVVDPDLNLYKCTVVFDNPVNLVGRIDPDGTLQIDEDKNSLWCESNAINDLGCSTCYLRIPCGGIACPLTRFTRGSKSCPDIKSNESLRNWGNHFLTPN